MIYLNRSDLDFRYSHSVDSKLSRNNFTMNDSMDIVNSYVLNLLVDDFYSFELPIMRLKLNNKISIKWTL